jgi:hypothetical protein
MGRGCSTHERRENVCEVLVRKPEGKEDLCAGGWLILKLFFN